MPTVTVIIPVKNRPEFLKRCLMSIDEQRNLKEKVEVIVVDDNSVDNTIAVAREWADGPHQAYLTARLATVSGHGAAAARNHGARLATGRWLLFFDSDDVMRPHHLANVIAAINEHEGNADLIGWDVIHVKPPSKRRVKFKTEDTMYDHLMHGLLSTQRYCLTRKAFMESGGYDKSLMGWIDWEFGVRLLMDGLRVAKSDAKNAEVEVMIHDESITGRSFSHYPERWENAINAVRQEAVRRGRFDLLFWVDLKAVILAADYNLEGAEEEGKRLLEETLKQVPDMKARKRLKRLYLSKLVTKRGTARLARLFIPSPQAVIKK